MVSNVTALMDGSKKMSEHAERPGSRWRNFLIMLPFFLIGIAVPAYYYGFSGDGGAQVTAQDYAQPAPSAAPGDYPTPSSRSFAPSQPLGVVAFVRDSFDAVANNLGSSSLSPLMIRLGALGALFVAGFVLLRIVIAVVTGALGSVIGFFVHKAAGPMFMGFLAVGSTWGIHQTIAQEFGLPWAATTVSLTAAIAALFALAGVQVRG